MGLRFWLIFLLMALAMVVESSSLSDSNWGTLTHFIRGSGNSGGVASCNGALVGDCIDIDHEMMMDTEISRRTLARARRYISYSALKKNQVPCNRRGHSYYNCARRGRANPYRRGCSRITRCARQTN